MSHHEGIWSTLLHDQLGAPGDIGGKTLWQQAIAINFSFFRMNTDDGPLFYYQLKGLSFRYTHRTAKGLLDV
jgi:hypothetical protein